MTPIGKHVKALILLSLPTLYSLLFPLSVGAQSPSPSLICQADLNSDGFVDIQDYGILAQHFFQSANAKPKADINSDGIIDLSDYALLTSVFFKSCSQTPTPTIAPTLPPTSGSWRLFNNDSAFNKPIPSNAVYTVENRIGSFRQVTEEWTAPIYRVSDTANVPLVKVVNDYSGRTENWPIPTTALPATAADHHMSVWYKDRNIMYEFWNARWSGTSRINAGGMKDFPISGSLATGISNPTSQTVVAAGFAVTAGMVVLEDFETAPNQYNASNTINHALTMALNYNLLKSGGYVAPAVDAETGTGDIPLGARYALPKNAAIESMSLHPLAKALLLAARDYGIFINDHSSPALYQGKETGTIRVEPAVCHKVFGSACDALIPTIQADVYKVVQQYKLYRVTGIQY